MKAIQKILATAVLISLLLVNCKCNESETQAPDDATGDTTEQNMDPNDSTMTTQDSTMTEEGVTTSDVPGVPAINSSFFGQEPSGAEVTYNFFGQGKFEKFSFKGDNEKNVAGTYQKEGDVIKLTSPEGTVEFKPVSENVYDVIQNGKKIYSVKQIN